MGQIKRSTWMKPLDHKIPKTRHQIRNRNHHKPRRNRQKPRRQETLSKNAREVHNIMMELSKNAREVHNIMMDKHESFAASMTTDTRTRLPKEFKKVVVKILSQLKKDEIESPVSISDDVLPIRHLIEITYDGFPNRHLYEPTLLRQLIEIAHHVVPSFIKSTNYVFYDFEECQRCLVGDISVVLNGGYIYYMRWTGVTPDCDYNIIPALDLQELRERFSRLSVELIRINPWSGRSDVFCDIDTTSTGSFLGADFSGDYLYMVTKPQCDVRQKNAYKIISISVTTRHIREVCSISGETVTAFSVGMFGHLLIGTRQYLRVFDSMTLQLKLTVNLRLYPFESIVCMAQTFDGSIYIVTRSKGSYADDRHPFYLCRFRCIWDELTCEPSWRSLKVIRGGIHRWSGSFGLLYPSMTCNILHAPDFFHTKVILDDEPFHNYVRMIRRIVSECSRSHGTIFSLPTVLLATISGFCFQITKSAKMQDIPLRSLLAYPRRFDWSDWYQLNSRDAVMY